MLHVGNFLYATRLALQHARIKQPAYVVTDETPYAISTIDDLLRAGLGKAAPKWRVPLWMLKVGATCGDIIQTVTGRSTPVSSRILEKLIGSAWYSAEAITRDLGYCPPYTFRDAVPEMIRFYRASLR
jgi:nucleoside-diphosphate-sugar epimerase